MPHFILIDHSITNIIGHHYQYAVHVLQAAADMGYTPVLATNRRFAGNVLNDWIICPLYEYGSWLYLTAPRLSRLLRPFSAASQPLADAKPAQPFRAVYPMVGRLLQKSYDNLRWRSFARNTARLLGFVPLGPDDLLFIPTLSHVEMLGVLQVLLHSRRRSEVPATWHLLYRHDLPPPPGLGSLRTALCQCRSADTARRMYFYTDSETLTEEYNRLDVVKFRTLPIPHTRRAVQQPRASTQALCIQYLGDARAEKGYQNLPGIVRALWADIVETGQAHFVLHSYFPAQTTDPALATVAAARRKLQGYPADKVRLVTEPLSPDEYWALLEASHIVILPYDPRRYAARSSGVLAEALAAGKPVLVPAGTWMSQQVEKAGPVGRVYHDIAEVPDILRQMVKSYPEYARHAAAFSKRWQSQHNASRLVETLRTAAAPIQSG